MHRSRPSLSDHSESRIACDSASPRSQNVQQSNFVTDEVLNQAINADLETADSLPATAPTFQCLKSTLYRERGEKTPYSPKARSEFQFQDEYIIRRSCLLAGRQWSRGQHSCADISMSSQKLEEVTSFNYLRATLCEDGTAEVRGDGACSTEVRIRIASAMAAMARLNRIWRCSTISLASKFKLYKSPVTSILLYG